MVAQYVFGVPNSSEATALERLLRPLSRQMRLELARALVSVQADQETQERFDELAGRRTDGCLTAQEQAELDALVRANTILGILKSEARLFLDQSPAV